MQLGRPIELAPVDATLDAYALFLDVYPGALHQAEIDHHAAVADGPAGHIVTASPDGNFKTVLKGKGQRVHHVRIYDTLCNHRRMPVDHAVVNAAHCVICAVTGNQNISREALLKAGKKRPVH